jgi:protein gp37
MGMIEENECVRLGIYQSRYSDIFNKLYNFTPILLYSQLNKDLPKKPQRIFVGSMSDIYFWKNSWMQMVLSKIKTYPQHIFQFLTKHPEVYLMWDFPENCWLGKTATNVLNTIGEPKTKKGYINYLSIEPLLDWVDVDYLEYYDWVIIGAETGNRKGKIIPKKQWITDIVDYCRECNITIYLKDSLKNIYPEVIKEFPDRR